MCAESHLLNSGFGRYTKEILWRLYNSGKYEIAEFASYLNECTTKDIPWKVYPNGVKENDPQFKLYNSNPINQFGQWRFEKVVLDFKPHIVFDIRDYWMFSYQEISPLRSYYTWVVAPTIDSIPQKTEWLKTYENADIVLTHTDWAFDHLKSLDRPINLRGVISDSVDTNDFVPINYNKGFHKAQYGIPTDSIIIGSVMRNQKRKLISELFKCLRKLIDQTGNNKIFLYLHTSYPESTGWDIPELLQEFGVSNNVIFTYYNPNTKKIIPSLYKGIRLQLSTDPKDYAIFPNVKIGVTNKHLQQIYNIFDIYIQYAICEGLGIPQLEAAACGIPVFAVNYSGMQEITDKIEGIKIKCNLYKELETGAERAYPDNDHLIQKVVEWMSLSNIEKKRLSNKTRTLLTKHYNWDITYNNLIDVLDSIEIKSNWNILPTINPALQVPGNLSNRHFINFLVNNVLQEPYLLKTYFIQNLVRSLDEHIITRNEVVKTLEIYMNNKAFCAKVLSGELKLSDNFLKC